MEFSFDSFIDGSFDYDCETKTHGCIWLREEEMDIGGGKITVADIDKLKTTESNSFFQEQVY